MFRIDSKERGLLAAPARTLELMFHATVREARKGSGNAVMGLIMNMMQTVLLVAAFYVLMNFIGRSAAIRGDFVLYVMSGIFLFITHTRTMAAVAGAEGPTSQMMKHAPMNPVIALSAAAFSSLYTQLLSASVVLYLYHAVVTPITIDDPVGTVGMFLLAWGSGAVFGMVAYAFTPWSPRIMGLVVTLYQRINMLASGKMFLANTLPPAMLAMFDWNPLFHIIDQTRGFVFLNYSPHNSSIIYPVAVTGVAFVIGLMGVFYTRMYASASWSIGR